MDDFTKLRSELGAFIRMVDWVMFGDRRQRQHDAEREYFKLIFPAEFSQEQVEEFIVAIGDNLRSGQGWIPTLVDSIVFEMWSSEGPEGIHYRIRVPKSSSEYLMGQLHGAIDGIVTEPVQLEDPGFQYGVTIHMHNPSEELAIKSVEGTARRLYNSMRAAVEEGDAVMIQWVVTHSSNQKMPPSDQPVTSTRRGLMDATFGAKNAGKDELHSRRQKQTEQNYGAIGRVVGRGRTIARAQSLVSQVVNAITAEKDHAYLLSKSVKPRELSEDSLRARTPGIMPIQFNVKELAALMSWPMGKGEYEGMARANIRHLRVPPSVSDEGIVLGNTTRGHIDRKIAVSLKRGVNHGYIAGMSGVGKTTLQRSIARQILDQDAGLILIERDGNLFDQVLQEISPARAKDAICIDLRQSERIVGFNLLRANDPEIVAGQLASLVENVFEDSNTSMRAYNLTVHGVPVLLSQDKATFVDLLTLVHPVTAAEKAWVNTAVAATKDKVIRRFWEDWHKQDEKKIITSAEPLMNRMNKLLASRASRYFINQEDSAFDLRDVIANNKPLLINLAGPNDDVASMIGSALMTAIWDAAKKEQPDKPNFVLIDEFQQFAHLSSDVKEMFRSARKRNLGLWVATQYPEALNKDVMKAVMENTGTKVVFRSGHDSAKIHADELASPYVKKEMLVNLKAYMAVARVMTDGSDGISEPMTMYTYPEPGEPGSLMTFSYNRGSEILDQSGRKYGRTVAEIDREDALRRVAKHPEQDQQTRQPVGRRKY